MEIKKYTPTHKIEWDGFAKNAKNSLFMHYRDYIEYHADRFADHSLLFYDDEKLLALLPLNIKENHLYSHSGLTFGGFIVSTDMKAKKMLNCFDSLVDYLKENHIDILIYKPAPYIYHFLPCEDDLYALYKHNAKIIKIEPSTTIFLKNKINFPKGRKAQIARARREGVIFEETTDFDSFIKLENEVLNERHNSFAVHTSAELTKLQSNFQQNIKLFVGKHQGKIVAGTVLFVYENIVHTQYLAADEKAREIGALDLVICELINKYSATKQFFDFGISTEENGLFLNEGLIAQKESFGGRTIVHQTWELDAR